MPNLTISVADSLTCKDTVQYMRESIPSAPRRLDFSVYDSLTVIDASENGRGLYIGTVIVAPAQLFLRKRDDADMVTISESVTTKMAYNILVYDTIRALENLDSDERGRGAVQINIPSKWETQDDQLMTVSDSVTDLEMIRGGWRDVSEEDDTWSDV